MHIKAVGLAASLVLLWPALAAAGPALDAAERAEALAAEGKVVEALDALYEGVDALWRALPLSFRTVAVVDSASGFGVYKERAGTTFQPDETLTVYVEPVGYGYGPAAEAPVSIGFTADLALVNATGQTLSETDGVFSLSASSGPEKREFYMTLAFAVPFLRPGEYTAIFTVHDQNSDKSGAFEVPFSVVLPAAQ